MVSHHQGGQGERLAVTRVHLPSNFSWEVLMEDKANDAALLELEKDVILSPKVQKCGSKEMQTNTLPYFMLSALLILCNV